MNGSPALAAALAKVAELVPTDAPEAQQVVAAKVSGMLAGYDARWTGAEWELEGEAERTVHLPIVNPSTGRSSRTFTHAGKFDGVVRGYGKRLLLEHKTTGDDVADPNSTYWRRLAIDSQVSTYLLSAWQLGEKLDGALYDVLRKPAIRPKKLSKADIEGVITRMTYCGRPVSDEDYDAVVRGMDSESPTLFALRVADVATDEPDRYFQRRQIPRLDDDVLEYANELWTIADEIRLARVNDRHFRNSASCLEFGRPCEYLGLCSGFDTPESDRWTKAERVHEEIDLDADGRDVLTNSRIKTFQSCRRKHFLRYEEGLRRADADEAESLYLGSLIHEGLAVWWEHQAKGETNEHGHTGSAVDEVAEPASAAR